MTLKKNFENVKIAALCVQRCYEWYYITLENHRTRTAQLSRGGCSRRVHKIKYLAVNKGNSLVNFLLLKILIANYYHL